MSVKKQLGNSKMWLLFAALTSIPAKVGIENVNSNLSTAVRTPVMVL